MPTFSFETTLACVFGALLFKGQPSEQFAVDNIETGSDEMQFDQHVAVIDKAATPLACSLESYKCFHINGGCYCFVNKQLPWIQAFEFCKAANKKLFSIESLKEEKNTVTSLVAAVLADPIGLQNGVWLSGTYVPATDSFFWASSVQFFSYTNWRSGEPNNVGNTAQCVRIVPTLEGSWASVACDQWLPFICED